MPYRAGGQIIRYLTRYTHRVAITNRRIVSVDEHAVRFRYRDYRDGRNKEMELSPLEFCRRFLQHVLPKGLSRIRHYGILSNRQRSSMLPEILFYFSRRPAKGKVFNVKAYLKKTYNKDLDRCPACKQGDLLPYGQVFWVPIRGDPHGLKYTINIVPYHTN